MIEFVRVKIFEWTFSRVISKLLFWKNRKFKEHHEGETIVCLAMFDLLNNSALLFIVGVETLLQNNRNYRSQEPESRCTNLSCSDEIIKFYLMYMVMAVCWTIGWKLILSKILDKLREYSNKAVKSLSKLAKKVKNSFHKAKFMKAAMAMKKKKKNTGRKRNKDLPMDDSMDSSTERDQLDRILYIHHSHPEKFYDQINQEIDYQVTELQAYKDGGELDQELFDYLEIFNLHSFLALFGVLFPIVFVIGLAITFAEWKMDLHDLIKGTKRSVPVEASSIGVWLNMLKLVSVLSACTNTFFVAFILFEQSSFYDKLGLFLLSSIGLLSMIFIWDHQYKMESAGSFIASRAKYIKGFLEAKLERRLEFSKDVPNIVLKKELTKDMRIFGGDLPSDHRGVNVQNLALQNDLEIDKEAQEKVFQAKLEMVYRSVCPSDKERRRDSHKQELVSPEPSPSRSPA